MFSIYNLFVFKLASGEFELTAPFWPFFEKMRGGAINPFAFSLKKRSFV